MGLHVSHGAWIGSYGAFMAWRKRIAQVSGLPPLELMEGFYKPLDKSRRYRIYDSPTLWTSEKPNH